MSVRKTRSGKILSDLPMIVMTPSLFVFLCTKSMLLALSIITFELAINLGVISSDLQPFSKRIKPKNDNIDKFLIIGSFEYAFTEF